MLHVIIFITDEERKTFMKDSLTGKEMIWYLIELEFLCGVCNQNVCQRKGEWRVSCEIGWVTSESGNLGTIWKSFRWRSMWVSTYFYSYYQITCLHKIFQDEEAMERKKGNNDNHISGELIYVLCRFIVILTSYEMTVSINSYFDLLLPLEEKTLRRDRWSYTKSKWGSNQLLLFILDCHQLLFCIFSCLTDIWWQNKEVLVSNWWK